jgi:hypothetical protein
MPYNEYVPHPEGVTAEEFQALLRLRREALDAMATRTGEFFAREVRARVGWKARIIVLERDLDGSLRAEIRVTGPRGEIGYRRGVRLVETKPLPWELGRQ